MDADNSLKYKKPLGKVAILINGCVGGGSNYSFRGGGSTFPIERLPERVVFVDLLQQLFEARDPRADLATSFSSYRDHNDCHQWHSQFGAVGFAFSAQAVQGP